MNQVFDSSENQASAVREQQAPVVERVLIVEDDPATRDRPDRARPHVGLPRRLRPRTARKALQKVTSFRPAIVVTDLVMPRMDGLELLQALREHDPDISVVILTAQGTVETAVEAIKDGAYDYLTKPVDPQRLQILLQKVVERQETLREVKALRRQLREQGVVRPDDRQQPRDAEDLPGHRAGGADARVGAHHRRVGHRQGAGGADDSPAEPARRRAVRRHQLRRDSRDAARERDLRPREGRVHRRVRPPPGLLRAGRPRHAVPRRDRRDDAGDAGEAAARAAGADVPAARRPAGADGRRARDRRDQPGPGRGGAEGQAARGPLLPPERLRDHAAAAARPHGGPAAADPGVPHRVQRAQRQVDRRREPARRCACSRRTTGRATSASCAT